MEAERLAYNGRRYGSTRRRIDRRRTTSSQPMQDVFESHYKSDISNGNGTALLESARECYRDWDTISSQAYEWPHQPRPGRRDKEIWQRILYKVYGTDSYCRLWNTPLGPWDKQSRQHARWMYDPASTSLYERRGPRWIRWATLIRRTRTRQYEESEDGGTL